MKRARTYSLALVVSMLISLPVHAQTPAAYPNTPEGLQQCLTDILATAKSGDRDNLAARIKDMEIPDFAKWFDKAYGKSKGKDSAELYRMNVDSAEYKFANYLTKLIQQDGQPLARKVNGSPQSTDELAMLAALKKPVDIYYASYTYKGPDGAKPQPDAPIGYFIFIDGKFRWSNALSSKVLHYPDDSQAPASSAPNAAPDNAGPFKPGKNGVGYPRCVSCPTPSYTRAAEAAHIQGVVVFQVVIQPNGRATDIIFVKGLGYGLDENALAVLQTWRFSPATGPDGKPVPTITPIEVNFRLPN